MMFAQFPVATIPSGCVNLAQWRPARARPTLPALLAEGLGALRGVGSKYITMVTTQDCVPIVILEVNS